MLQFRSDLVLLWPDQGQGCRAVHPPWHKVVAAEKRGRCVCAARSVTLVSVYHQAAGSASRWRLEHPVLNATEVVW